MRFNDIKELVAFVTKKAKLPEWQTQLFSQYSSEIQVHSKGQLFYKIDRLFPNEHPQSKEHRVLAFEAITKGSFWKGVNNVVRIFHNSSYTAEASENTVNEITQHKYEKKNLFSYFLEKWCDFALAKDPNGLIVVYPFEYMKDKAFTQLAFIESCRIKHNDRELVIFESEELSEKKIDLKTNRTFNRVFYDQSINKFNMREENENTFTYKIEVTLTKKVWHVFTPESFYEIHELENNEYDIIEWKQKKTKFIPCISVGGMNGEQGVYQSFFSVFCAFGNLALMQHSQHTAVNFMFSFPRMSEIQTPCEAENCQDGLILLDETHPDYLKYPDGRMRCASCGGSGYKSNQTPYKTYVKQFKPELLDAQGTAANYLNFDEVKFYTPPVDIVKYSKQEWRDYLDAAEQAVYVSQKVQTGNVESAQSKEIDREDRYNFLSQIANIFYDRMRFVVQCFENYLNASPVEVSINVPFSYAIVSEGEAFAALQEILKSDAPVIIKANQVENFVNKFVSQSSPVRKAFNVLKNVDLLFFYSDLQVISMKANHVITAEQWATHTFAFPVLFKMFNEDRGLFELEEAEIGTKLEAELVQYMPAEDTSLQEELIKNLNSGGNNV